MKSGTTGLHPSPESWVSSSKHRCQGIFQLTITFCPFYILLSELLISLFTGLSKVEEAIYVKITLK